MKILRSPSEVIFEGSKSVGLVPTMGAFHQGHLSLMRTCREECDVCVVSLFVNPTQFGPNEDFSLYPRNEARDFEMAERIGVDAIFAPSVDSMYEGSQTSIHVAGVSDRWEGERRPGHFDGVATVVAKLFLIVRPNRAYFGEKDYQQCAVLRQMVRDLNFPLELRFCPTVRESDGLAMSSRNVYLSPEERAVAPLLKATLEKTAGLLEASPSDREIEAVLASARSELAQGGFEVDYFALVNSRTLEPLLSRDVPSRLIAAAKLGRTRLIDNWPITS